MSPARTDVHEGMNKSEIDGFLPAIGKRHSISKCDTDALIEFNESPENGNSRSENSNSRSIPNSRSSSPVKLPTIDRSKINSTGSVSSLQTPESRGHRSRDRRSRRALCRSPSCPSVLTLSRNGMELESPTFNDKSLLNASPTHEDEENDFKLPSIFRNSNSMSLPTEHSTASVAKWKMDREQNLNNSLRRSESYRDNNTVSPTLESRANSKIEEQRSKTQTALLLPMRNNDSKIKGKKKKGFKRQNSLQEIHGSVIGNEIGASRNWHSDYETDLYQRNGSFEQIIEENENNRHIEIARDRNYNKPWMKDRPAQKEGQVKA